MPSNKMSGYKNRNRTRERHWREHRQDGLLGSAPRSVHGRQQQGLLGGGPHGPAMAGMHRPNPWESGMMPGNRALPSALPRSQAMWGGNAPQPPSLLGTPDMLGGGRGGAGLLGGVPREPNIIGINQLGRINGRDAKMGLSIIDNVVAPQHGGPGPRYGQFPHKMGHLDRGKMARGRGRDSSRSAGGGSGSNDLRKWLKDKRGLTSPRAASRQFGASSSSHHRSSSASSSRKDRPESSRGESPAKAADDKDAEAEEKCPVEALHCHVCNVTQFSSIASFKQHQRSSVHEDMLSALYRKNSAVLDLLRQQSKIAAMQQTLAATVDDKEPKKSQCYKCFCKVPGSLQKHIASVEHKLVNNFQIVKCCNVWFSSRPDYEQHKLGFRHLLTKYEEKQQKLSDEHKMEGVKKEEAEEEEDSCEGAGEWWHPADRALRQLHRTPQASEPLTCAALSPYSGLTPVGESFVRCRASLECSACDERFDPSAADMHCRSNAHYLHVLNALKAKDEVEAAAAASEKATDDELAKSKEDTLQNQSNASNLSAVKSERPTTSDDEAEDGSERERQNATEESYDLEEKEDARETRSDAYRDHRDDQDDDEDERMMYEGLRDEPQLEFDDDEEEIRDSEACNAKDDDITSECGNATTEELDESALVGSPVKGCAEAEEDEDEEDIDQYEYELIESEAENKQEEQGSSNTDTQSLQRKDTEPVSKPTAKLEEEAATPLSLPAENVPENNENSSVNEKETEHKELEDVKPEEETPEAKIPEEPDQPPATSTESEQEEVPAVESQATRRSGRASRKRAAADDAGEEPRVAEPTPKRGRGRGRGRGGRK